MIIPPNIFLTTGQHWTWPSATQDNPGARLPFRGGFAESHGAHPLSTEGVNLGRRGAGDSFRGEIEGRRK
jgi:hypothetical protein